MERARVGVEASGLEDAGSNMPKHELQPGRGRVDAWLGRIIGALLIAILVTAPLLFGALRHQDFFWVQVLGVIAGSLWLVRLWVNPQPIFLPPMVWPLVAFCVYAVIRYFTSDVEYLARKEVVRVLFYMMFFVLALNHFREQRMADIAVSVLIVLGMALSVYALRQYLTGTGAVWHLVRPGYAFRGSGTFIYPNHFAGFVEMLLALGLGYVFLGRGSTWLRVALAYCSLWLVLGLYVSKSRAGWIVMIGSLLILLPILLRNRRRQVAAFASLVVLLIGGLIWELKTNEIGRRLEGLTSDHPFSGLSVRRVLWNGAYQIWRAHPLWGGDPGHYDERFRLHRPPHFRATPGHAHCDYLHVLADWGGVGAGLLAVALGLYLRPLGRNWIKTVLDPTAMDAAATNRFALTCGGFAGTLAVLAHSLVDYQWYAPGVMLTLIAIVAMLLCQTQAGRWNFFARLPLSVCVVALLIVQAVEANQTIREQYWLARANKAETLDARIADLKRAFEIEPRNFQTAYWVGDSYRLWSWEGAEGYERLAEQAIPWFDRAARLNRLDPYPPMRKAMCLDWLKRHAEAEVEIQKAIALEPNHYIVLSIAAWHYFQAEDDEKTLHYLKEAHARNPHTNPMLNPYFQALQERMQAKSK